MQRTLLVINSPKQQMLKTIRMKFLAIARYLHEGTTTQHRWVSLGERFDVMRRHYGLVSTLLRHIVFPMRLIGQKLLAMLRRL